MTDVLNAEWRAKSGRLWSSVSNYYVKTLVGWRGSDMCDSAGADDQCANGVGLKQLAAAKEVLRTRFDVVLITGQLLTRGNNTSISLPSAPAR